MGKHLLILGAGHAHMTVLKQMAAFTGRGHAVTVVSPDEYQYYSGMGPGMFGGFFAPERIRIPVARLVKQGGGTFVLGRVKRLVPDERAVVLESGERIEYDVASCNLGSEVPRPWEGRFGEETVVFPVKPITNLMGARRRVLGLAHGGKSRILVAGGGPAAVEVAGNAWRAARQCIEAKGGTEPEITILAGRSLLRGWPQKAVDMARGSLARRGLKVVEDGHVVSAENGKVVLENGVAHQGDLLLVATGTRPPDFFEQAGMQTGPDGGMAVNRHLQSLSHPEVFGGGDCLYHSEGPLARVGVYAVRQNPVLRRNLMAALEGGELTPFKPQQRYMLIMNMGDGTGLLRRDGFCCLNRPSFWLKNMIDRRFISKHQA